MGVFIRIAIVRPINGWPRPVLRVNASVCWQAIICLSPGASLKERLATRYYQSAARMVGCRSIGQRWTRRGLNALGPPCAIYGP